MKKNSKCYVNFTQLLIATSHLNKIINYCKKCYNLGDFSNLRNFLSKNIMIIVNIQ